MLKHKPFPFSVIILVVLVSLHLVSSYYSLYWSYPWLDILIHILSGLWVALVFLWLAIYLGQINSIKDYKIKSLLIAIVSAVFIGVAWELLENFGQITFTNISGYGFDTAIDLLSDTVGALLAYLYFVRKTRCLANNSPVLHPFYDKVTATCQK